MSLQSPVKETVNGLAFVESVYISPNHIIQSVALFLISVALHIYNWMIVQESEDLFFVVVVVVFIFILGD